MQQLKGQYVYIAKPSDTQNLLAELCGKAQVFGNLILAPVLRPDLAFALDVWQQPKLVQFDSITQAAKLLKQEGKYWQENIVEKARRTVLIREQLRPYTVKPLMFPCYELPKDIGVFSLLDQNTLLYSAKRWKPIPNGEIKFIEDKILPPNRAYLKLWEALTLLNVYPKAGEIALDLGASPGGWTTVLQQCGAQVIAVDKAPLDPKISRLKQVQFLQQSAFALEPKELDKIDWLVCDIACYPERLLQLIQRWLDSVKVKQMICTIKLQGNIDWDTINQFKAIENARVLQLFHNKHELTFFYPTNAALNFPPINPIS